LKQASSSESRTASLFPAFPDVALQTRTVGSANETALREASRFYSLVKDACAANGMRIGPHTRILDFGVGCGRIVRFFLEDTDAENLHGLDANDRYLDAAREAGCQARLERIDALGSLPFADATFDFVYAYSVFTHLPEHVQDQWLGEIRRVLKAGGTFVATVEPPRFLDFFRDVDPNDEARHPWLRILATKIAADPGIRSRLKESGFSYNAGSDTYGDAVMTPEYVHRHWGQFFQVIGFLDDPQRFWQAVAILRR
jgi:ubiquinone/menaquinone biosynthesis C-methylase UbiE